MKECHITKELLEQFGTHLYLDEKSETTVSKYTRDIEVFCKYLDGRSLRKK